MMNFAGWATFQEWLSVRNTKSLIDIAMRENSNTEAVFRHETMHRNKLPECVNGKQHYWIFLGSSQRGRTMESGMQCKFCKAMAIINFNGEPTETRKNHVGI